MGRAPIVVMDSGIGGLPYFSRVRELLPGEHVDYVADTAHFPYGDRSDDEVVYAVLSTVARIVTALKPLMVVVACNTASVLALEELRRAYDLPFVGVVPAVKPACRYSETRSIGVLATERTIDGAYLDALISKHCSDCAVTRIAAGPLVTYVERTFGDDAGTAWAEVAAPYVARLHAAHVDSVVLGCTHFVYLADVLAQAVGPGCRIIDSRDGVARRTARVVADLSRYGGDSDPRERTDSGDVPGFSRFFVTSNPPGKRYQGLASGHGIREIRCLPSI